MIITTEHVAYLSGQSDGSTLSHLQRDRLDRIKFHLESEATWVAEGLDARSRLLAAAAAEPAPAPPSLERHEAPIDLADRRRQRLAAVPDRMVDRRQTEAGTDGVPGRNGRSRAGRVSRSSGVLLTVAAAAAAIGFASASLLGGSSTEPTVASYELAATPLDPDASGVVDIRPTPAGVEIELHLTSLDHTGGPMSTDRVDNGLAANTQTQGQATVQPLGDGVYYAAWLMSGDDTVPLGSFHWRSTDVPIVLWSGVDDPAYNLFAITRQAEGDKGVRSDEVVLMGQVPSLTG